MSFVDNADLDFTQYIDSFHFIFRRKEKEFEEGMNHLQKDIDTLEMEKRDLRENLKVHGGTKKGDAKQATSYGSGNFSCDSSKFAFIYNNFHFYAETSPSSPYAAQELSLLKKALNDERSERIKLQASEMSKTLSKLTPIYVPQPKDNRINELEKNLTKVKHVSYEWMNFPPFVAQLMAQLLIFCRIIFCLWPRVPNSHTQTLPSPMCRNYCATIRLSSDKCAKR